MKKTVILPLLSAGIILTSAFTILHSAGIPDYTGSPVDGASCNASSGGCHSGGTATTVPSLVASPAFGGSGNALTYIPGTTYTVTVKESGYPEFGFDVEILNSSSASTTTDAGTMTAISTNCKKNGTAPTNITHNTPIATGSSATFKWVAPASGTAYLYAAVNGVNADGNTTGDKAATVAYTLTANTTGIARQDALNNLVSIYPNPASNFLTIHSETLSGVSTAEMYDITGRLVLTQSTDESSMQLNLAKVTNGTYFVKVTNEKNVVAVKMIIVSR